MSTKLEIYARTGTPILTGSALTASYLFQMGVDINTTSGCIRKLIMCNKINFVFG